MGFRLLDDQKMRVAICDNWLFFYLTLSVYSTKYNILKDFNATYRKFIFPNVVCEPFILWRTSCRNYNFGTEQQAQWVRALTTNICKSRIGPQLGPFQSFTKHIFGQKLQNSKRMKVFSLWY